MPRMEQSHPIRGYRERHGLSLEAFGLLVKVQKSAVSKWEAGRQPSPAKAKEIEEVTKGEITKASLRPDLWAAE